MKLVLSIVLFSAVAACGGAQTPATGGSNAALVVQNRSNYTIMYMYMSSTSTNQWGADHLGSNVLAPGGTFTLYNIPCDRYDIRLIDEDQDECILNNVEFCGGTEAWSITNEALLACEGYR